MHATSLETEHPSTGGDAAVPVVDFLWLEVTNQCNLQCGHCYSDSSPTSTKSNLLKEKDYLRIIGEARRTGCSKIQFIGGEPTLNRSLLHLVEEASTQGYGFIEVFTNLVWLSVDLLQAIKVHKVAVATSFYSSNPDVHDAITNSKGSFGRTVANIKRVLRAAVPLRVGLIEMEHNKADIASAERFLRDLGVTNIGMDRVRAFGRARGERSNSLGELCGGCAGNILAIGPDGVVAPCIMSKHWAVGSVLNGSLDEVLASSNLGEVRQQIAAATGWRNQENCYPQCNPHQPSCAPACSPSAQCIPCAPNGGNKCQPNQWCNPAK